MNPTSKLSDDMDPQFNIKELTLPGVFLITPQIFPDQRGYASVVYHRDAFKKLGIESNFVQGYLSFSKKDVIRGMHFQKPPFAQDKLVSCSSGRILDVVLDHDQNSPTFRTHVSVELDTGTGNMLFIPGVYAHGFCVLSETALVEYKLSDTYHPESTGGIRHDDPLFNIRWPAENPILSAQDAGWPTFAI